MIDYAPIVEWVGVLASAGGGHHGPGHINWFVLGSTILNAVIFFGYLAYILRPTVRDGLKSRRASMEKALRDAEEKQAQAAKRLEEYAHKLANLEEEVAGIVAGYEAQAKADKKRLEADTERAIERLRREADFTIGQEIKKAEKALRQEAIQDTLEAAAQMVQSRITEADRRRLVDQYVQSLEQSAGKMGPS